MSLNGANAIATGLEIAVPQFLPISLALGIAGIT